MKEYVSPTLIASYKYCPRLCYLNTVFPHGDKKSTGTVLGIFEHEVFGKHAELTRIDWLKENQIPKDEIFQKQQRIQKVLAYAENIAKEVYPEFIGDIHNTVENLQYRLGCISDMRFQFLSQILEEGMSYEDAVNIILPWRVEQWFKSDKLGIRGRADAIYRMPDSTLLIEDIKSHNKRLDAFIHKDEIKTQLTAYAVLSDEMFNMPTPVARIFYSQDLSTEHFHISDEDKEDLIQIKNEAKNVLENGLPPKLSGEESIKCQFCYKRNLCFGFDRRTDDEVLDQTKEPKQEEWKSQWR